LDVDQLAAATDTEANPADVIEQSLTVDLTAEDDDWRR
jgi:hypothetical protein